MAKIELKHVRNDCIGCGACAAIDPDNWEMDGDKARLKDGKDVGDEVFVKEVEDTDLHKEPADSCPVPCIFYKKLEE